MFIHSVSNTFYVEEITRDPILTVLHSADQTSERQHGIASDSFHLESVWYCVGKHESLLIYANLHKDVFHQVLQ